MPVYDVKAPDGRIFKVNAPENARQEDLFAYVQQQIESEALRKEQQRQTGVLETFGRGVSRGFGRLGSTITDTIPALAGSALGFDEYAQQQIKEAQGKEAARQAESPTLYPSMQDIRGPGTFLGYAAETLGEQVANLIPGVGGAVGGGAAAARLATGAVGREMAERAAARGLTGSAAQQYAQRGAGLAAPQIGRTATRGQVAGAGLGSYALTAPEIFQGIYEETGELAPGAALLFGAGAAALDSILPYQIAKNLSGPMKAGIVEKVLERSGMDKGLLRSATAGLVGGVATEGLTEGAQEAIGIAAERFVDDNPGVFGSKEWNRIMESMLRGAVAGGAFGGIGGAVEGARARAEQKRQEVVELERQGRLEEAQRAREELTQAEAEIAELQQQWQASGVEGEFPYTTLVKPQQDAEAAARAQTEAGIAELTQPAEDFVAARAQKPAKPGAEPTLADLIQQAQGLTEPTAAQAREIKKAEAAQQQAELVARTDPARIEQIPTLDSPEFPVFAAQLGLRRPNANALRTIAGADLRDPAQAATAREVLKAFADKTTNANARERIDAFLNTNPGFRESTDVGESVAGAGGAGAGVVGGPEVGGLAGATGEAQPSGVEGAGEVVGEPAGGAEQQPGALTEPEVEAAPVEAAPVEAAPVEAAPVEAAPVEAAPVEAAPVEAAPPTKKGRAPKAAKAQAAAAKLADATAQWGTVVDALGVALPFDQLPPKARARALAAHKDKLLTDPETADSIINLARTENPEIAERVAKRTPVPLRLDKTKIGTPGSSIRFAEIEALDRGDAVGALKLIERDNASPVNRLIAKRLIALQRWLPSVEIGYHPTEPRNYVGIYDASTHKAYITPEGLAAVETLLHEMMHGVTARVLRAYKTDPGLLTSQQIKAAKAVDQLYTRTRDETTLNEQFVDAMSSVDEFVAYGLTSPEFQNALKETRLPGMSRVSSVLSWFATRIKELLGLDNVAGRLALEVDKLLLATDTPPTAADLGLSSQTLRMKQAEETAPAAEEAAKPAAKRAGYPTLQRGSALERDLYGGRYDATSNADPALRDKARQEYNDLRADFGLPPVTDWSTKPKFKVSTLERRAKQTGTLHLFAPKFRGADFTPEQLELAKKGDLDGLLRSITGGVDDPAIKQVLQKIAGLNLKTKLVSEPVSRTPTLRVAGSFDPATNTIAIDPEGGMNTHTFVHEMVHAAISHVIANRSHPLTKRFEKFFLSVQGRLGAAYGAQNLQEFAAELISNPEFQALLKDIKTPRSESLFRSMMRSIAEFFGFNKSSNAYARGLDFVNDIIDISSGVEPTPAEKLFLGMGSPQAIVQAGKAMPALQGGTVEATKNYLSNLSPNLLKAALGLLRLDNLYTIYKQELPSIKGLMDAIEMRAGLQERNISRIRDNYEKFRKIAQKFPAQMEKLGQIAIDARLASVNILDPNFKTSATNSAAYTRLSNAFKALPPQVQEVYREVRKDYDAALKEHNEVLIEAAKDSPSLAAQLREEYLKRDAVVSYVPFLRSGDFWVSYVDPDTKEPAVLAFESLRERAQFVSYLNSKKIAARQYQNLEDIRYTSEGIPPSSFIYKVMQELERKKASQAHKDAVWQSYLATFPSGSIMKQFMKSKNLAGMETDLVRGYGDIMVRWSRKLANAKYGPDIDKSLYKVTQEAEAQSDPAVYAAAQNILGQAQFLHNPTFNSLTSTATTLSYFWFMAGNISTALINMLSMPMMVWPKLVGDFGWDAGTRVSLAAGKIAINNDWTKSGRYKGLYEALTDHAQLEHTQTRELLEGRRQKTTDYTGRTAKILDGISKPLAITERYNRATTAIAAFDLMKGKGAPDEKAIEYAIQTVKDIHTSGMAATGPRWMQGPIGRVFFTFKSFVWNSAFVTARAFHQSMKGATKADRDAARRQLLAMYGMAFAFTGLRGMPFYGAVSTMSEMISALFGDEDEPFDFDQFVRDSTNDFLFKGPTNYLTNMELATRAGIANDLLFRDDPRFIAEHGYMLFALSQILGPIGSLGINLERGIQQFNDGNVWRAVETLTPVAIRNGFKGVRFMNEGATTLDGDPIMEDINAWNSTMQLIGFAPADLANTYERLQAAKGFEREVQTRRTNLTRLYDMAQQAGDSDMLDTARERIDSFNEAHPEMRITPDTLRRSQRAREAAEREMINGVRFNKNLRARIQSEFFDEE